MEKKINILIAFNVVLIILVFGLVGFIIIDKSKTDNTKVEEVKEEIKTDVNKTESEEESTYAEYVGTYDSVDGSASPGNEAYIILKNDGTYERNQNDCSAISTVVGSYEVKKSGSVTIITFTTAKIKEGIDLINNEKFQFKYKNGKLSIIDENDTYAYYDCSNSRTFKKR